jgi:hypothetical protein
MPGRILPLKLSAERLATGLGIEPGKLVKFIKGIIKN